MSDVAISDMADVNPPARIPKGLIGESTVPFIPMTDVSESGRWTFKQSRPLKSVTAGFTAFEEGDVLVAKITPCLENGKGVHAVGLENGIGFGSTEFHVLRARMGNEPRFVFHLSQWRRFRRAAESQMVGSAGQQRVPRAFFDEFRVSEFSAVQQARIAQVLDALDTAIHETEAIIAKLKAVKQGLLHDLLTRGIDANGELRPPQTEAPHLYKQSPLGWIPKEWHTSGLAGVAPEDRAVIRTGPFGSSLKGEHWRNSGTPVVTIGALGEEEFIESELLFVDEVTAARLGDFKLIPGDVVFSRVADVGRSVVVSENERGWIMSSNFMRISCDSVRARPHFLQLLLSSSVPVRQQLRTKVNSAGRDVANSAVLMGLSFPWPSPREQDEILRRVNTIGQLVIQRQAELKKLLDVKLGLMDDLLTGRVRVTPLLQEAQQA